MMLAYGWNSDVYDVYCVSGSMGIFPEKDSQGRILFATEWNTLHTEISASKTLHFFEWIRYFDFYLPASI